MASMAISCVDLKTSPFLVNLNAGFFSLGLHGYSIAELNLPVELFFATSKIVALSWLEAAGSFAGISDIKSRGLPTS